MDRCGPTCLLRDPDVLAWPEVRQLFPVTGQGSSVLADPLRWSPVGPN